jgi:hypothetical protein
MLLCAAACLGGGAVAAQTGASGSSGPMPEPRPVGPLHTRFLTATGATVPKPALLPRDPAPVRSGRSSYEKDRRIEHSICSNC